VPGVQLYSYTAIYDTFNTAHTRKALSLRRASLRHSRLKLGCHDRLVRRNCRLLQRCRLTTLAIEIALAISEIATATVRTRRCSLSVASSPESSLQRVVTSPAEAAPAALSLTAAPASLATAGPSTGASWSFAALSSASAAPRATNQPLSRAAPASPGSCSHSTASNMMWWYSGSQSRPSTPAPASCGQAHLCCRPRHRKVKLLWDVDTCHPCYAAPQRTHRPAGGRTPAACTMPDTAGSAPGRA
jgi:hypothetical protein